MDLDKLSKSGRVVIVDSFGISKRFQNWRRLQNPLLNWKKDDLIWIFNILSEKKNNVSWNITQFGSHTRGVWLRSIGQVLKNDFICLRLPRPALSAYDNGFVGVGRVCIDRVNLRKFDIYLELESED